MTVTPLFVSDIQREQEKVKRSIKDAAKKGQKDVCVVLAKEMIQSKRAITKLHASKAQMNSVVLSMKNQLGECGSSVDGRGKRNQYSVAQCHQKTCSVIIWAQLCH